LPQVKVAALDLGSNSFHLLVVEVDGEGPQAKTRVIERAREMVRLGESTLLSGVIPTDGFERGLDALERLRVTVRRHQPHAVLVVATSAIREASNGAAFVRAAREVIGADIRVVDGHEEARLVYFGVRSVLALGTRRVALFDLGGGSLEIVVADAERVLLASSLKLGVLRLRDQWLAGAHHDVVGGAALDRMRTAVREVLSPAIAAARTIGFDFVVFTAGTARALRAMVQAAVSGTTPPPTLTRGALAEIEGQLASLPAAARAALPGVDSRRLDTLLPGATVLRTILELADVAEATYSEAALREGMIAAYLAGDWS
jgi:exopolyphosphatase / guanosine-5'-triphosphate,3'-diphosphate pyrophosphatase